MRKTRKEPNGYADTETCQISECSTKLGPLEDVLEENHIETPEELDYLLCYARRMKKIEEKLGVDLTTFFKALENGAFIKLKDGRIIEGFEAIVQGFPDFIYFAVWGDDVNSDYDIDEYGVKTKDHGETWALTKEELC